jgi:ATP-dependent DNA ligase
VVIASLYTADGELVVIGRTVPLKPAQSAQVGAVLSSAGAEHPWPDEVSSQRWGGPNARKPLTTVQPTVIAEVTADAATQAGQVRHGMRYDRLRPDLRPEDLPTLPDDG